MKIEVIPPQISFCSVGMHYGKDEDKHIVFENISLNIFENEFVVIVGGSGCGKTTLLNLAAGFIKPSHGSILVKGEKVDGAGRDRGVVFQQYAVFPWLTVRENIEFPLNLECCELDVNEKKEIVEHYLMSTGLKNFENSLPKALSGGMKQRVAIARAYAANPQILLMDEPFAALDAQSRTSMQEVLQKMTVEENKAALFITHSVEEAIFLADRIVVMGNQPAVIKEIINTPFASKKRDSDIRLLPEFIELRRHIEKQLKN
jgi:NitT/TauT family transport system ATP-binding protein